MGTFQQRQGVAPAAAAMGRQRRGARDAWKPLLCDGSRRKDAPDRIRSLGTAGAMSDCVKDVCWRWREGGGAGSAKIIGESRAGRAGCRAPQRAATGELSIKIGTETSVRATRSEISGTAWERSLRERRGRERGRQAGRNGRDGGERKQLRAHGEWEDVAWAGAHSQDAGSTAEGFWQSERTRAAGGAQEGTGENRAREGARNGGGEAAEQTAAERRMRTPWRVYTGDYAQQLQHRACLISRSLTTGFAASMH